MWLIWLLSANLGYDVIVRRTVVKSIFRVISQGVDYRNASVDDRNFVITIPALSREEKEFYWPVNVAKQPGNVAITGIISSNL